jgi:prepilin-type processing-associated H-X9-DG protein
MDYMRDPCTLKCDQEKSDQRSSYGMNARLSGVRVRNPESYPDLLVIYETAHPGNSPYGGPGDVVSPPRHLGGNNYGFADGHVRWSAKIPSFSTKQSTAQPSAPQ